jgi:Fe-S-cluster containining protein
MVLGQMIGMESAPIVRFHELESGFILCTGRRSCVVHVVKDPEFHRQLRSPEDDRTSPRMIVLDLAHECATISFAISFSRGTIAVMANAPQQFRIFSELVTIEIEPPPERMRLDEILPVLRELDDRFAATAVRRHGQPVTCARGCSACCRVQAVPVTPAEAYALLLLVENLPEPRRAAVLSRFADRAARLEAAGLAEGFLKGRRPSTDEEGKAQARQYLDLGLVCPFLEDDDCGIYPNRPFSCREYFVTTPKELCTDPLGLPVRTVPRIAEASRAVLATAAEFQGGSWFTIPLTLALVYAAEHREELQRTYDGNRIFTRAIGNLFHLAATGDLTR